MSAPRVGDYIRTERLGLVPQSVLQPLPGSNEPAVIFGAVQP